MINVCATAETMGNGVKALISETDEDRLKKVAVTCLKYGAYTLAAKMLGTVSGIFDGDILGSSLKIAGVDVKDNLDVIIAGSSIILGVGLIVKSKVRKDDI